MKLAVTGKGGVGKTTVSSLLSKALAASGHKVIAIDADPDSNLAACMGYETPEEIKPLVELHDLIEERTGVRPGTTGGMYRLNPLVEDIPDRYSVDIDGVKVLVAGAVKKGGSGCYCPENSLLRALISHLLLDEDTALILDMEAGVEHLGRGTIDAVDQLLIVADPGRRAVETALRIKKLASDIGLEKISAIGNKIRSNSDIEFLREALEGINLIGTVPYEDSVLVAERNKQGVGHTSDTVKNAIDSIVSELKKSFSKQ